MASLLRRSNQFSRSYRFGIRQQSSLLKRNFVSSSSSSNKTPTSSCPFHSSPCLCFSSNNPSTPTCPFHSSPCRCFSSSSASFKNQPAVSNAKLSQVIHSEIQYAEQDKDDLHQGGVLPDDFPFEVIDNPGEQIITLKRELNGESIEVVVHMAVPVDDIIDEDEDGDKKRFDKIEISLNVTVTKGDGPCLEFLCIGYPEGIVINSMLIKGPEGSCKELPYEGPEFTDLDEKLQREFHGYLERRGIKNSLQDFLREYMMKKDGKEYVNWLKNMKQFVEN